VPLSFDNQLPQLQKSKPRHFSLLRYERVHALCHRDPRIHVISHVAVIEHIKAQTNLNDAIFIYNFGPFRLSDGE
jgi:hypothetical protein